jgi:hypothetical protein
MDENLFRDILAVMKIADSVEVEAARILVQTGEALAGGNMAPLEAIHKTIEKTSKTTAARVCILIGTGVLSEVNRRSNQAGKLEGRLEGFERGWEHGFDRGFTEAIKISRP